MSANNALRVTGLDFDTIRQNLRNFMANKPQFRDYDFDSSAIGALLDVLAYNTYYNAFYANMSVNEGFLDSAQLRPSVVSRAKSLGYTPTSARGATATINIKFPSANTTNIDSTITIPKGQQFTSTVNNIPLIFSTTEAKIVSSNSTNGFSANLSITEGTTLTHRFTVTANNAKFVVPNANVDTRFLTVTVQTSGTNAVFTKASTLYVVNGNSNIYFLNETSNTRPLVLFGDNIIGNRPENGSTVFVTYPVVNALDGNGANNFSATGSIGGQSSYIISTVNRASGGANIEGIESIRDNAVRNFETQERAVTANDYKRIILDNSSDIKSVRVFGGEEAQTPVYGRVYISTRPIQGSVLSNTRKTELTNLLKDYNVQSIEPVFIDPTYLYIVPTITVRANFNLTTKSTSELQQLIAQAIINYETNNLGKFEQKFITSKLTEVVDGADVGIVGSFASFELQKRFRPDVSRVASYTLNFNAPIENQGVNGHPGYIKSTPFVFNRASSSFDDDGFGKLRIRTADDPRVIFRANAGSVNYSGGIITISDFLPTSFTGDEIAINVETTTGVITPQTNTILLLRDVTIRVINDQNGQQVGIVRNVDTDGQTFSVQETALTGSIVY